MAETKEELSQRHWTENDDEIWLCSIFVGRESNPTIDMGLTKIS